MSIKCHSSDDEPCNSDRAEWAERALAVFCDDTGLVQDIERDDAVSDLMCNIGHYCDLYDLDFLALASRAIGFWTSRNEKRKTVRRTRCILRKKSTSHLFFPPNPPHTHKKGPRVAGLSDFKRVRG